MALSLTVWTDGGLTFTGELRRHPNTSHLDDDQYRREIEHDLRGKSGVLDLAQPDGNEVTVRTERVVAWQVTHYDDHGFALPADSNVGSSSP